MTTTPVVEVQIIPLLQVGDRLYDPTVMGQPGCGCRRCAPWKEDYAGCIPMAWAEEMLCFMAQLPGPYSNFSAWLENQGI